MSVFRVEKNKNYTVMANHHLNDKALSLKAKGLLSFMLSLPEDWDYSVKGICAKTKEGIKAIRTILHELEETGYLVRTRTQKENGYFDYDYCIYEKPATQKPCTQNGYTVEGHTQKATQLNTNIQNTKQQSTHSDIKNICKGQKPQKFQKPTLDQVKATVLNQNLNVDPEYFYDYYESNGWKISRTPMKDWKATLRNWHRRNTTNGRATSRAVTRANQDDQPYEPEPNEDIRPWRNFFDQWQETLGMRPAQTVGNVRAAKQLVDENDPETIQALLVALALRSETGYLTKEIKNIATPMDLCRNRERVWAFYQEHREEWAWKHGRGNKKPWEL